MAQQRCCACSETSLSTGSRVTSRVGPHKQIHSSKQCISLAFWCPRRFHRYTRDSVLKDTHVSSILLDAMHPDRPPWPPAPRLGGPIAKGTGKYLLLLLAAFVHRGSHTARRLASRIAEDYGGVASRGEAAAAAETDPTGGWR